MAAEVVALFPAAGRARRLPGLPGSKEVVPLAADPATGRRRLVCEDLLAALAAGGVRHVLVLTRRDKLDVPRRLAALDLPLAFATLVVGDTPSVVHTLDTAYPFTRHRRVALGFPDVLLAPATVFAELLRAQEATAAALVLGLFPAGEPERSDMVELDAAGRPRRILVKAPDAGLRWTWMAAVWAPPFGELLHRCARRPPDVGGRELQLGDVVQAAIDHRLPVAAVPFPHGRALDVGTPAALARARR